MTLHLALLGTLQIQSNNEPPLRFPTNKTRALLAYLVVENNRSHSRRSLANLLWPNSSKKQGRQNLSQTLRRLRQTIPADQPDLWASTLQTTAQDVMLISSDSLLCDVNTFQQLLAQTTAHQHSEIEQCPVCLTKLEQAIALYQGDFLADFSLPDAAPFEEWATSLRNKLQHQLLEALDTLIAAVAGQGNHAELLRYAEQQVAIEPWRDEGWRFLLWALIRLNRHHEAVQRYHHYRQSIQQELGIQPTFTLRQLVDEDQAKNKPNEPGGRKPHQAWQSFFEAIQQDATQVGKMHDFAVSQTGNKVLAVAADGSLHLWDVAAEATDAATSVASEEVQQVLAKQQTAVTSVALSPNGRLAAAGTAAGRIICWQVADGAVLQNWAAHEGAVHRLTFLPSSHTLLSSGSDGVLRLWGALNDGQ